MIRIAILFSALCLFVIGCYVMFKPDLSDLGFIPVLATNPETASESVSYTHLTLPTKA